MKYVYTIFFLAFVFLFSPIHAQERLEDVRAKLKLAVIADTMFLSHIDLTVSNMPVGELLRNVGKAGNVSISYKGDGSMPVNCNLNRVRITDFLLFLCRQYNLDLDVVGNIVSVFPYDPLPAIPGPKVFFHPIGPSLSYEFHQAPLPEVVKLLADASGINLVIPTQLTQKRISGYAVRLPVDEAIRALAEGNELIAEKNGDNLWSILPAPVEMGQNGSSSWVRRRDLAGEQLIVDSLSGRITAQIQQGRIYDILCTLCELQGLNYYFISPIDGQTSLFLKDVELHTLLKVLFTGTSYSYYEEEGILMFGASREEVLASVRVVPLQNRTVNNLIEAIPPDLTHGVQVKPFKELNSLILSGDQRKVARVEHFVKSVDQTVPLITIEVLIVDASKSRKNEQGISLGIGEAPVVTSGTLSPGLNLNLNASGINSLIHSFNGFGAINLGKVTPNFYANLQFLEANGDIELQSTPKLSTLNGHEAELSSGERRHYKEVNESLMGSQNPIQTNSYQWKYIDANLDLKIAPFVSGNGEITLSVEISQTEFTTQEDNETPPGTATRSFKSEIRVLNEEMVLLGGIERTDRVKTSKGLPFIARLPVLKWLFGQSVDNDEVRKLNIFIKPTVIY